MHSLNNWPLMISIEPSAVEGRLIKDCVLFGVLHNCAWVFPLIWSSQ